MTNGKNKHEINMGWTYANIIQYWHSGFNDSPWSYSYQYSIKLNKIMNYTIDINI
jgi:hypothetical protein